MNVYLRKVLWMLTGPNVCLHKCTGHCVYIGNTIISWKSKKRKSFSMELGYRSFVR